MRITKSGLASSLYGLIRGERPAPSQAWCEDRTEEIRLEMIELLSADGEAAYPGLCRRIVGAEDATALWYLRSTLMAALCALRSERQAQAQMAALSARFEGVLPPGLSTRPSPLGREAMRR